VGKNIFMLYRDSLRRREALQQRDSGDGYLLYGLRELIDSGHRVGHNLETTCRTTTTIRCIAWLINKFLGAHDRMGEDFSSLLACRNRINASDVVVSTVDTLGIPLALLKARRIIRTPSVYVSIGLPERLMQLSDKYSRNWYSQSFQVLDRIICYGFEEFRFLQEWLPDTAIYFIPFGVNPTEFEPRRWVKKEVDVLSVGADKFRDFDLLIATAREMPQISFEIITTREIAGHFYDVPGNIRILCDVPLEVVRERMNVAGMVALPVVDNSYSGATTTLLQAMSMGKAVIISRVGAIRQGYHLQDGQNCRFVQPGNAVAFSAAIKELVTDAALMTMLGSNAAATVRAHLTWDLYITNMKSIITEGWGESGEQRRK